MELLHCIPGRARFRLQNLGGASATRRICKYLEDIDGIERVTSNLRTRSILVRHTCAFDEVVSRVAGYVRDYAHRGPGLESIVGAAAVPGSEGAEFGNAAGAIPWASRSAAETVAHFGTSSIGGLDDAEALSRLGRYGVNRILERPEPNPASYLARQVVTTPIALLGAAAVVSIATGGIADAIGIAAAIALNSLIGATTEWQADKTIRLLSQPATDTCQVRRRSGVREVRIADVVPGDLLLLAPGTLVPADARLMVADRLMVDESALTGESMPRRKDAGAICGSDTPLADLDNMVFRGTAITGGSGLAVVVATGLATQMGQIQATADAAIAPKTPMELQLGKLGTQLTVISIVACAGVFAAGMLRGGRFIDMLKAAVSLGVAAVPEGLPAVATTTLALGLRNMRDKGLLVRNINAVETIGAVDVVCLDKTGTLTKNRIEPAAVFAGSRHYSVEDGKIELDGQAVDPLQHPELQTLLKLIALCNDSTVSEDNDTGTLSGTATENTLLELAIIGGLDVTDARLKHPRLDTRYRSETVPYMTTLHQTGSRGRLYIVKGSPREVLALCTRVRNGGRTDALDDQTRASILQENDRWSDESLRVLGVAYDRFGQGGEAIKNELTWLGLVGMQDPLRHGMKQMIADLHSAGIKTAMITGDQMGTATAIGRQLALSGDETLKVLDSSDLSRLEPTVRESLVRQTQVFARVSPTNKLAIVQSLQRAGNVVAMTGDGINDGPALKAADVGIAMGNAQSDVARSVADIVVADDRLESVIAALAQGRSIYANVRKSIHYLVSTNLSEIEVMLAGAAMGTGVTMTPMQLLWINLATDALPAIALGLEPPDTDVLRQPPRAHGETIISQGRLKEMFRESGVITAGAVFSILAGRRLFGPGDRSLTMGFNSLVISQLLHAFACRSDDTLQQQRASARRNRVLTFAIGGSLIVHAIAMTVPPIRAFLGAARLGFVDTTISTAAGVAPILINDLFLTGKTRHEH